MAQQALATVQTEQPPRLPGIQAGGMVRAIVPQDFDSAWRIANAVVKAGMAPKGIDSAEKAMVAILHGLEVGFTPMAALQSIAPINGRPAIWGDGALGLVQGSGKLESIKEYYIGTKGQDDYTAVCEVKRAGNAEVTRGEFSIADAKLARLWNKEGPWTQYWPRMLKMRARSFALRDAFSDVLRGLSIAEEAQDIPMKDVTPPKGDAGPPRPQQQAQEATAQTEQPTQAVIWDEAGEHPAEKTIEGTATEVYDETQWLKDLEGAYAGCEDTACLSEQQQKVMMPLKGKVPKAAWKKAEALTREHLDRIQKALTSSDD